jgi:hypothetical protein
VEVGGRSRWASAAHGCVRGAPCSQRSPYRGRSGSNGQNTFWGGCTMRDPEQVARAQHAAARLESAWERWRSLQGMADTPAQPVVGYVGYALKEPWGQPRAVIGFSADEAERLADFLEHGDSDGQPSQSVTAAAPQPVTRSSWSVPQPVFRPQPTFTPQGAAPSAVPPPAAQRQPPQRQAASRSAAAADGHRNSPNHIQAPAADAKPGAASEASREPQRAPAIPEQQSRADMAADRSLRASYALLHRVASASYKEPV